MSTPDESAPPVPKNGQGSETLVVTNLENASPATLTGWLQALMIDDQKAHKAAATSRVTKRRKNGSKGDIIPMADLLTPNDAYHLARSLAGGPLDVNVLTSEQAKQCTQAMISANGGDRDAALTAWMETLEPGRAQHVREAILSVDPDGPPPAEQESAPLPEVPRLPDGVQPDPALGEGAGIWLDRYVDYAQQVSPMTPRLFHESAGLVLGSIAIARRLKLAMSFDNVYPNLWVAWIAPTTVFNKTTALNVARRMAYRQFGHLLAAQDSTVEALLCDMAGCEPTKLDETARAEWIEERNFAAQRGWIRDEISGLLAAAGKDYNRGFIEALIELYDCTLEWKRSTRAMGRVAVKNAYLTLLGASTPAALAKHLAAHELWTNGWWPRFALLMPDTDRPAWRKADCDVTEPSELSKGLSELYRRLPKPAWPHPPEALSVLLDAGVLDAWDRYDKAVRHDLLVGDFGVDPRLCGTYGRLPTQVLKVAIILATFDWPASANVPRIELPHLARAIAIVERWRASAHRVLTQGVQGEFDALRTRILCQLGRFPNGAGKRDLYLAIRPKRPAEIGDALRELVDLGEVELVEVPSGPRGGRPTVRYHLPGGGGGSAYCSSDLIYYETLR